MLYRSTWAVFLVIPRCPKCDSHLEPIVGPLHRRIEELEAVVENLNGNNEHTARVFRRRIKDRFVLVEARPLDPFKDFSGVVIKFRPGERVDVMDMNSSKVVRNVPITQLYPDPQRELKEHYFGHQFPKPRVKKCKSRKYSHQNK